MLIGRFGTGRDLGPGRGEERREEGRKEKAREEGDRIFCGLGSEGEKK